jgi:hypothetical protein
VALRADAVRPGPALHINEGGPPNGPLVVLVHGSLAEGYEIEGAAHGAHMSHPDAFASFARCVVDRAVRSDGDV